jgi:hypothetical protein
MIKDVHISNPNPRLRGDRNSVPMRLIRAELSRLRIFWRRLWPAKLGKLRSRAVGDSVLYHSLFGLASPQQGFGGICPRCWSIVQVKRPQFVNTRRLLVTDAKMDGSPTRSLQRCSQGLGAYLSSFSTPSDFALLRLAGASHLHDMFCCSHFSTKLASVSHASSLRRAVRFKRHSKPPDICPSQSRRHSAASS